MATSVVNSNGIANDLGDHVDGLFSRRISEPMFEASICIEHFNSVTSKEDFPLHYAVFQGDVSAVQKVIDETNINSLDTHGEYKEYISLLLHIPCLDIKFVHLRMF